MKILWWLVVLSCVCVQAGGFDGKKAGVVGVVATLHQWPGVPEAFGEMDYVLDIAFSASGQMAVVDGSTNTLFIWDEKRNFLQTLGGEGQGPGELAGPTFAAFGDKYLYVYEFQGIVVVYTRGQDGRFSNKNSVRHKIDVGYPRVFSGLPDNRLMLARSQGNRTTAPLICQILDPANGDLKTLAHLEIPPQQPIRNVINMSDPREKVWAGMPRLWASPKPGGGMYYGFSENNTLLVLDNQGKLESRMTLELPQRPATSEDRDAFMNTRIAIVEKSMRELEKGFEAPLAVVDGQPLAYYSHFIASEGKLLFFTSAIGGFQMADYIMDGYVAVYDPKTEQTVARGLLKLPEEGRLFFADGHLLLRDYDKDDRLRIREVKLGWL